MPYGDVALDDVPEKLFEHLGAALAKVSGEAAIVQVRGERGRAGTPAREDQVLPEAKGEDLEREVPARQFGPELAAQQRRIRARDTNGTPAVQERPDEALPLRDLLNFVQENGRFRTRQFLEDREERREVLGREAVQSRVLEVAVERC